MPVYRVLTNHSLVQSITVIASSYEEGKVIISFPLEFSANLLIGNINLSLTSLAGCFYQCQDTANTRPLIEKLIAHKAIQQNDFPAVYGLVQQVEKHLAERNAIKRNTQISQSQDEILLSVADVYIDDILESTSNHIHTGLLLRAGLSKLTPSLKSVFIKYLEDNKINLAVWGSVEGLMTICSGNANLETTYLRMNQSVPSLLQQRNIIFKQCIKKLLEKYGVLDEESKIFMIMELEMFRMDCPFSPLEINSDILKTCLSHEMSHPSNLKYFPRTSITPIVSTAFSYLEINKPLEFLVEKIKFYQNKFNSPALQEWLNRIDENNLKEMQAVESKILQGLKANDESLILEGIEAKEDINQYTRDAITFLIHAVRHCTDSVVNLLLNNGALVNKPGQYGQTTAIGEAVKLSKVSLVTMLLKAGADVHSTIRETDDGVPAYKQMTGKVIYIKNTPLILYVLRRLDLRNFKNDTVNLSMFVTLLHFGAGIGTDLPIMPSIGGKFVFFGAPTFVLEPTILIKTAAQFIEHISTDDYEHWGIIFKSFLQKKTFVNRSDIESELKTLVLHIDKSLSRKTEEAIAKARNENLRRIVDHYKLPNAGMPALQTAFRRAAALDDIEALTFLSTQGVDINVQDDNPHNRKTALHWAVINQKVRAVKFLRGASARTDIRDATQKTASDYANESNNNEIKMLFNLSKSFESSFSSLRISQ